MEKGNSFAKMDVFTPIGLIKAQIPTTASKLNKFEPTTLPSAISFWPLNAAVILTAASGALVPKATIVSPIIKLGILKKRAMEELPLTKKSAPFTKNTNPMIKKIYANCIPPFQK